MAPVTIKVTRTGPYIVEGEVQIIDHEGNPIVPKGTTIKLCRCGGSTTKPFCDGTHSRIGFLAAEQAVRETDAR
jgi:3-phenylpropionate/trans-cinnamate dioxygenase ferredoxin subunit